LEMVDYLYVQQCVQKPKLKLIFIKVRKIKIPLKQMTSFYKKITEIISI
jgi:hypothetical protein